MNKKPLCIIFNPAAKGERSKRSLPRLHEAFREADFCETSGPGHATELAASAADEYDTVIAAGGDGTINEVVNGMAGREAKLGVLPVGSVNVFAMELGLPMSLDRCIDVIRRGKSRAIDLAKANDRYFVQLAGVGLDAETVRDTAPHFKKSLGPLSYVMTLSQVASREAPPLEILNGHRDPVMGSFILVGNGRHYGGPFHFFPQARLDDGQLDVCVFHKLSHFDLLRYFRGILTFGTHTRFSDVTYFKTDHLEVRSTREVPFEVDGEFHGNCPVTFSVLPAALKVLVP
ncbi:MAG: diacylglycerol/lipid kinase family protein [Candidatus Methylacidiphilales bacterium]